MKSSVSLYAIAAATCGLLLTASTGARADTASEIRALKARLQQLEAQVSKQAKETKEAKSEAKRATNIANVSKGPDSKSASLPPVFVSLKNGLTIETEDGDYNFHVGGRLHVAGSAVDQPLNGFNGQVGIRRARIQVEGKAKSWFYKAQYDFGTNTTTIYPGLRLDAFNAGGTVPSEVLYGQLYVTQTNQLLQGIRDFYFGYQGPLTETPVTKKPLFIIVGNQFEPFSLEAVTSSNYIDLAERSMATDVFSPARHIGAALGGYGDNWSAKGGIFSTSPEDANLNPGRLYADYGVLRYRGTAGANNWYQNWGGGQYFDVTGRATYAPIRDEHNLLHVGVSGRYHQPNQATGFNDDRVLVLGNRSRSEDFFSGQALLGTPDLSCGTNTQVPVWAQYSLVKGSKTNYLPTQVVSTSTGAVGCTKNVMSLNAEFFASYGSLSLQGEYYASWYNRDPNALLRDTAAQLINVGVDSTKGTPYPNAINPTQTYFNPGGSSLFFSGYYVQAQYWLTGEEKVSAYRTDDKAGASFRQIKIKHPLSAGGWGAWGIAARLSEVNLNYGPFTGQSLYNALYYVQNYPVKESVITRVALQNQIVNAGVNGGAQQNVTLGFNWLPEEGVQIQGNWTRVVDLKSPFNQFAVQSYYSGAHPNLFQLMGKVYW